MNIQDLDIVDNNNQQNWPEGTMKVQDVNDAGRADEGLLARWFADWNGSKITAGTGSAYTLSSNTVPTAYYDGFQVVCEINVDCLADATLNVDSLGAATIKKNGTENLVAGDLKAGMVALFVYRGTDWNLVSAAYLGTAAQKDTGTAPDEIPTNAEIAYRTVIQVYSASGTFEKATLPADVTHITVECVGGAGAGGGAVPTGASETSVGSGGGGGGYAKIVLEVAGLAASETITVGAGGTGAAGTTGGTGGSSSFGTLCVANGGIGGETRGAQSSAGSVRGGAGGGGQTGTILANGSPGGIPFGAGEAISGVGGSSVLGGGAQSVAGPSNGISGANYGGGSGAANNASQAATRPGGDGSKGVVIVSYQERT